MRVVLVKALPPGSTVLPLVSWQFVVIQVSGNGKIIDPVLAFAKDNFIHFFQVRFTSIIFFLIQSHDMNKLKLIIFKIINLFADLFRF